MHVSHHGYTGLLLASILVLGSGPARAGRTLPPEARERIRPVVGAAIDFYNDRATDRLPTLSTEQIETLLQEKVVRIRRRRAPDRSDSPERVTGYRMIHAPRDQVWVAALDPEFLASDLLTESRLSTTGDGISIWHQYLSLPWPISDRQWVIQVGLRRDLAVETDNLVWEQTWRLADHGPELARQSIIDGRLKGIDLEDCEKAVYVPHNEGSWIVFRLEPDITLVAYRLVTVIGGDIPESWITTMAMAKLAEVLDAVAEHALEVRESYDPEKTPIVGGDGTVVSKF